MNRDPDELEAFRSMAIAVLFAVLGWVLFLLLALAVEMF